MPELELKPLPFDEAITFFREKGYAISPDSWRDVWAAEHVHAFTVARVTAMDVLEDIRGEVDKAIEKGTALNRFQTELGEILERKGWAGELPPWRLSTIYRTNLQGAYGAGRYMQQLEVARRRPWWLYDAVDDMRTRPSHAMHDGTVRRFDHPFWDTWYPPNGFNCRCVVRTLSERQMHQRGLDEETRGSDFSPDEGFEYNPGMEKWRPDLTKYAPESRRVLAAEGATHPRNVPALAERLTRYRDGMRETGMPASTSPLRLLEDHRTTDNAWARYETGQIGIRADLYSRIRTALRTGEAMNEDAVNAFKTLVHEVGHHLGYKIDLSRYWSDEAYRATTQTVNDLWARHNTAQMLKSLQLRYSAAATEGLKRYHPTGYQPWVERMRAIFRAAGLDEAEEKALVARLNLSVSTEEMSEEIWSALRAKKPELQAVGEFGQSLINQRRFEWLLDQLSG